jgi:osmotically-inducible protein OsmY
MSKNKTFFMTLLVAGFLLGNFPGACLAIDKPEIIKPPQDKTVGVAGPLAERQTIGTKEERETTKKIWQAIEADNTLAKDVNKTVAITTERGMVTLKGHVRTEQEKMIIAEKASQAAGDKKIMNEIMIEPRK